MCVRALMLDEEMRHEVEIKEEKDMMKISMHTFG